MFWASYGDIDFSITEVVKSGGDQKPRSIQGEAYCERKGVGALFLHTEFYGQAQDPLGPRLETSCHGFGSVSIIWVEMEIVDPSSSVARLPSLPPVSLGIFWIFQTTVWWGKKSMIFYNILFSMVLKLSGTEPVSNRPLVYPAGWAEVVIFWNTW